jgi:hypothetical protein
MARPGTLLGELQALGRRLRKVPIWVPAALGGLVVIGIVNGLRNSGSSDTATATQPAAMTPTVAVTVAVAAPTATPDVLVNYASRIAHQRQVMAGVLDQFAKDTDSYNRNGLTDPLVGDLALIEAAARDAEKAPPPPALDASFVAITQAFDAFIKSASALDVDLGFPGFAANLNGMADHPAAFPFTRELASSGVTFSAELQTLDKAIATLPAPSSVVPTPVGSVDQQIEKSIRDNKDAVYTGTYSFDHLAVHFDPTAATLTASINPDNIATDTELLTNASALVIIAGKAVWSTYPQVSTITIKVAQPRKDASGRVSDVDVIVATYGRAKGAVLPFLRLVNQPHDDNKVMLCNADAYSVATYIWGQLGYKGCMALPTGGIQ